MSIFSCRHAVLMRTLRTWDRGCRRIDSRGKGKEDEELESTHAENILIALLTSPIEDDSKIGNKWLNGDTSLGTGSFKGYAEQ